ncbi:putative polysaccharide biosynthesis protein [Anaerocolumna aminovalerica]|uniref:putative polysaccharide biosynthesis protein n=1 Tax=Anaerocolumna aminovalerica TaxID=1527 RepID=UPI000BE2B3E4|nr:polysaccharide biosynthesis protein [Anaerocolumna aminovalerica]
MGKKNNFLVQGSILAVSSILVRLIGLLYGIPLTNMIGDEGMGYYSNAFYIYNIALIISSYSLPLAVSKLVSQRNIKKEYRNSYRVFLCSMGFALVVGAITSLVIYFGSDFLASAIYDEPRSAMPLRVLAPTIFVFAVMGVLRGFFQGKNTMLPTAISQILEQIVNAAVSLIAAYILMKSHSASDDIAAYGAAGGTLGTFIGACIALLFLAFVFALYKPIIDKQLRKDKTGYTEGYSQLFTALFITLVPVILSQTVYQLSSVIDNAVFGHVMGGKGLIGEERSALLGIYARKYNILINVPVAIASALASTIVPGIASAKVMGSSLEIKNKVHSVIKFNMLIAIPSAVGLGVLASPILQLLFHDNRSLPANLLYIGAIAVIFLSLSTITSAVLQGINKMHIPVIHSAISLVVHTILIYVLLQVFDLGIYSLVIGTVTFGLMVCILNWIAVKRYLNYKQEVVKTFIMPGACAIIMGVIAFLTYFGLHSLLKSNFISTIAAILIAVLSYGILILVTKTITEEELYEMPMGRTIIRYANKFHLM